MPYLIIEGSGNRLDKFKSYWIIALFLLIITMPSPLLSQSNIQKIPLDKIQKFIGKISEHHVKFENISVEQGLSQSTVRCILQDSKGFMWFGTDDGLNRYDGYNFKIYKNDPQTPDSLIHNLIWSIYEDYTGMIWIGTHEGLSRFDRVSGKFINYRANPANPECLSQKLVRTIYEDRSGVLWFGTNGGLNRFNRETETFTSYTHKTDDPYSLSHNSVRAVFEDSRGNFWVGTYDGLNKFDRETGQCIIYRNNPEDPLSLSHNRIRSIYEDNDKNLWIGTFKGLNLYDFKNKNFIHYQSDSNNSETLSNDSIRVIYEDYWNNLWIGTDGGGLNRFERSTSSFIHYKNHALDSASLSNNRIRSIYEDRSGILWIGTYKGGLSKLNWEKRFAHYRMNPYAHNGTNNNVRAICEDRKGRIWFGSNEGLNRVYRNTGLTILYQPFPDDISQNLENANSVFTIIEDSYGIIWAGTRRGGLLKLEPEKNQLTRYLNDPDDPESLSDNRIRSLYEDRSGCLWIGTYTGGLNRFDRETGKFIRYSYDFSNTKSASDKIIYAIHEDRTGTIWIGTGNGLISFDVQNNNFIRYKRILHDPMSLSDNGVLSILEDNMGTLWIGTYNGLNRFDRITKKFKHYSTKDGLPNNVIYGILEDDKNYLWLSTNKGLAKFDPLMGTCSTYDVKNGIQAEEFYPVSYYKSQSGEMFVGGINGFNAFFPNEIIDNLHTPPLMITDFQLFGTSVPIGSRKEGNSLNRSLMKTESIEISYKNNVFSFEFAVLDYTSPEKNQYAYMMEGFDRDWMNSGNRHFAMYTNLPPGDYTFRVRGSNSDGVWNNNGASLHIVIHPPWWASPWFKISILILMLGSILGGYGWRVSAIKSKKRRLETQVKERTNELILSNKQLYEEIKERKRMADALQERERSMKTLVSNLPGLAYRSRNDEKWTKEFVSEGCYNLTGYRPEAFIDNAKISFLEIIHPDDREYVQNEVQTALDEHRTFQLTYRIYNKDGLVKWVWEQGQGVVSENGEISALEGLIHDITESKQAEDALEQARKTAEIASRAKSEFLAKMSHEIRTPMNAITGLTHLAIQTELTVRQRDYLNKIRSASHVLLGVINDILDFSKIEAGKMEIEFTEFNLEEILDNLSHLLKVQAEEKEIEILFSINENVPHFLIGDPLRLGQILINLTSNALKFTESGEIVISVELLEILDSFNFPESSAETGVKLRFSVRDTGIGISQEDMKTLFEAFTQADDSTTRKFGGTGLGLTICKRLTEMMGGEISVESTPGKGSIFYFTAELGRQPEEKERNLTPPDSLKGMRILVADDNQSSLDILQDMLLSFSFDTKAAVSGKEALEILERSNDNPFKLVCLDWNMPGINGIETSRLIRKNPRIFPKPMIIMISGYGEKMAEQAHRAKSDAVLIKPVNRSVLFDTIIELFNERPCKDSFSMLKKEDHVLQENKGAKILLVEDNKINQQVARELLESAGFTIQLAENGLEAVQAVKESDFDLVLMDIQMPEMDGYEAAREIRKYESEMMNNDKFNFQIPESQKRLPVIAMTAHAMSGERDKCLKAGMDEYVSKPIEPELLFSVLSKWINNEQLSVNSEQLNAGDKLLITDNCSLLTDNGSLLTEIDVQFGLKCVAGNTKLYMKLLREFYDDYKDAADVIWKSLKNGDLENISLITHTIKGVAGNMGAKDLYQAAFELNSGIRERRTEEYEKLADNFEISMNKVMNSIKCLNEKSEETDRYCIDSSVQIDFSKIQPLLTKLEELLGEGDSEALECMNNLKICVPPDVNEYMILLEKQIDNYDFEDAQNTLENIVNALNC